MQHQATHTRHYIFTPAIRIFHWLRALSIFVLIITGFYLAWPFLVAPSSTDVLVQGWLRFAHIVFGFTLTAVTIARFYLFFFRNNACLIFFNLLNTFELYSCCLIFFSCFGSYNIPVHKHIFLLVRIKIS